MKIKNRVLGLAGRSELGRKAVSDRRARALLIARVSMGWNFLYGLFNGVLGVIYGSLWFGALFVYYIILGVMRLSVVSLEFDKRCKRTEKSVMRNNGRALIFLAAVISAMTCLSFIYPVTRVYNKIVMIAIAAYTFFIAVIALVNIVKAHRQRSALLITLRNISCAGATASMLSLARSMIATFGDAEPRFAKVMNGSAGMGGFLAVVALGVSMIVQSKRKK